MSAATKTFENESQPFDPSAERYSTPGDYGFKPVPRLLFRWSRLFQAVVSQVGSHMLSGKFHDQECGIYKCEGGCRIVGGGDLVLGNRSCYWDRPYRKDDATIGKMASLITAIVLAWDPCDPSESMMVAAASHSGIDVATIRDKLSGSRCGGVFGGDALTYFFRWNPFTEPPRSDDYERFCLTTFSGWTDEDVTQKFADRDEGKRLLDLINEKIGKANPRTHLCALCCSPNRDKAGVRFWINTGRFTQIDGWKSRADIDAFLAGDGVLKDER